MNFWQAIAAGFINYVNFSGRAIRSEYWYWILFATLGGFAAEILDVGIFSSHFFAESPLNGVFDLLTLLPSLSVAVRRLHDIDHSGWWVLITFTVIGVIVLLYWACRRGTPGPNRFGPDRPTGGEFTPRPVA